MVMRIARQRRQFKRIRQPWLHAEPAQAVEKVDGLGVSHQPEAQIMFYREQEKKVKKEIADMAIMPYF